MTVKAYVEVEVKVEVDDKFKTLIADDDWNENLAQELHETVWNSINADTTLPDKVKEGMIYRIDSDKNITLIEL